MRLFVISPAILLQLAQAFHPFQHGHHIAVRHARVTAGNRAAGLPGFIQLVLQPIDRRIGLFRGRARRFVLAPGLRQPPLQHGFQIAQGHREHAIAPGFDNAESGRKPGQWRVLVGAHCQGKSRLVGELASGVVGQVRRDHDDELGAFWKRTGEKHLLDKFRRAPGLRHLRRNRFTSRIERNFPGGGTRHRRAER